LYFVTRKLSVIFCAFFIAAGPGQAADRVAFFRLFLLAPVLNIFLYDLTETRFWQFPLSFSESLGGARDHLWTSPARFQ
jgi:hypothetical protein